MKTKIKLTSKKYMPQRATLGASGYDLKAARTTTIAPGDFAVIPTGVHLQLEPGMEAQVRSRSGLAAKHGIAVLNAPGTIDSDYTGEIKVILINHSRRYFRVVPGARIAQLVFAKVTYPDLDVVDELDTTDRADGGFGSTGE